MTMLSTPDFNVVARAGVQIKLALNAVIALDDENYVFWGGRGGYMSLLVADKIIPSSGYEKRRTARYSSFDYGKGKYFKSIYLEKQ